MSRLLTVSAFALALAVSIPAFAADGGVEDAGLVLVVDAGVVPAPTVTISDPIITATDAGTTMSVLITVDGGVIDIQNPAVLDNPQAIAAMGLKKVMEGDWLGAIALLVVLVVSVLKVFGKKIHEMIPDSSWADKPFWFLFETKVGGWIMNFLTVTAGGVAAVLGAGTTPTWGMWKAILTLSLTSAGVWALIKDITDWAKNKKPTLNDAVVPPTPPTGS